MKIKEKFAYVDDVLYPHFQEVALRGFLWPLLSALFLLFIYPIPSRWVFEYVRNEQKKLKAVQQRIEDETPVTQEEARSLKASIRDAARTMDKEISERDATIKSLNSEIEVLRQEITTTKQQVANPPAANDVVNQEVDRSDYSRSPLSPSENLVLRTIAENDGLAEAALKKYLKERHALAPLQVKYFLDELMRKGLVAESYDSDGAYYSSTPAGRSNIMNVHVTVD